MTQDLRHAVRTLRRSPGFTLTAILILAIAMGANTAIFSVIEAVLLRPLPYHDPQRLCVLWKTIPGRNIEWDWTSYPTIRDWRDQNHVFADVSVVLRPEGSLVRLANDSGPEIQASKVFGAFFDTLGVAPLLGRAFTAAEVRQGDNVAVLSYGFWQRRFGGKKDALGHVLEIDNRSFTIVGVMPPGFDYPDKTVQFWLPLTTDSRWLAFQRLRVADAFLALARLKPGVSIEEARTEMNTIAQRLAQQYPATDRDLGIRVVPLFDQIAGSQVRRALWVLGGAVFCVLLIACSNIASLLTARGAARGRELAVRAAIGASRRQLLWHLAAENIVLCLAGGVAGLLLAFGALRTLLATMPADLPRSSVIAIDGTVLAFTFGLCLTAGIVFGLLPASRIVRSHPMAGLRGSASRGLDVNRLRGVLVASQFALAIILLTGAGLLIRSFLLLDAVKPGFDTTHLLTMSIQLPDGRYGGESRVVSFFDQAISKIEALPGVRGAAVGPALFGSLRDRVPNTNIVVEGRPFTQEVERHGRGIVSDGYFSVLGIPLMEGRLFSHEDLRDGPRVAVINRTMARRYWPLESPLGRRFKEVLPGLDNPWHTVTGVTADVLYNRDGQVAPMFYYAIRQWPLNGMPLVVRTAGDPLKLVTAIREAVRSIDAAIPYFDIDTVEHGLEQLDRPRVFQTRLIVLFALVALILAALGLYGLMRYAVEQRTKEIGIRVALGATSAGVIRLVLRQGLKWALAGMGIGFVGAIGFGRVVSSFLFGITPADPATLGSVIAVLVAVMVVACGLPTRRATKVDPVAALRHE